MLVTSDLTAGYGTAPVLHGVSLEAGRGEIVAIVGRNGVGKTTLIKTLMGVLPASSGSIALDGIDVTKQAPSQRVQRGLRATFQERGVFAALTVADNLRLNGFGPADHETVLGAFPDSLSGRASQVAGTLSGGQQKMLASAIAVSTDAPLLLMDEPTEGLQPSNVDLLGDLLVRVRQEGRGVVLVEQHLALATRLANRFVVLEKGEIVDRGEAGDPDIKHRLTSHLVL